MDWGLARLRRGGDYREGVLSAPTSVCKVSAANEHTRYSGILGHWPC